MKKLFLIFLATPTVADVTPLGGTQSNSTFNPMIWEVDDTKLNAGDKKVYININQNPEEGGIANRGGWNYLIQRVKNALTFDTGSDSGSFTVGETVTGGTSGATGIVIARDHTAGTLSVWSKNELAFKVGETVTGGTSSATCVLTTSIPQSVETYATSLKDHPYRFASDGTTPLKINADVIDLETCLSAYVNHLYHTA